MAALNSGCSQIVNGFSPSSFVAEGAIILYVYAYKNDKSVFYMTGHVSCKVDSMETFPNQLDFMNFTKFFLALMLSITGTITFPNPATLLIRSKDC